MSHGTSLHRSLSASNPDDTRDNNSPASSSAGRRKKHVTTACDACRKAKAKCDGIKPCGRCVEKLYPCSFAPDEDNRNRGPMKRKLDKAQSDVDFLHDLMGFIRVHNDDAVAKVIFLIRSNASYTDVHQLLKELTNEIDPTRRQYGPGTEGMRLLSSIATQNLDDDPHLPLSTKPSSKERDVSTNLPRRVFGVDRLTHIPLYRVPATPWTTITDDDDLVSHLVSLYGTWEYVFFDGLVLEPFLRDMRGGQLDSPFCSSFLVNCVLATACPYSDFDEVRTQMGRTSQLMDLFIGQAESMLAEDISRSPLTAAQGLTILSLAMKKQGKISKSQNYMQQALMLCSDLIRDREEIVQGAETAEREELSYVVDTAIWGIIRISAAGSLGLRQPVRLSIPPRNLPQYPVATWQSCTDKWTPYPVKTEKLDSHYTESRDDHAKLVLIERQLSHLLILLSSDDSRSESADAANMQALIDVENQLTSWVQQRSYDSRSLDVSTPICVVLVRLWEAYVEITTFQAQLQLCSRAHSRASGAPARELSNTLAKIRQKSLRSALAVVDLLRVFRDVATDLSRIHPLLSVVFRESLGVLLDVNTERLRSTSAYEQKYDTQIFEICLALRAMARRNPDTTNLIRRVQVDAKQQEIVLPLEALKIWEDLEPPLDQSLPEGVIPS